MVMKSYIKVVNPRKITCRLVVQQGQVRKHRRDKKAPPGFEPGAAALQVQRSTTEL